ncbi:DUF4023 domain-containing protein [Bacillus massiliglaciei]|nr:DUF4023 domain-containing protein [Bacillus massiliglaciei]
MKDTNEFVEEINENQKKAEKNKKRQSKGTQSDKLPNKQH